MKHIYKLLFILAISLTTMIIPALTPLASASATSSNGTASLYVNGAGWNINYMEVGYNDACGPYVWYFTEVPTTYGYVTTLTRKTIGYVCSVGWLYQRFPYSFNTYENTTAWGYVGWGSAITPEHWASSAAVGISG